MYGAFDHSFSCCYGTMSYNFAAFGDVFHNYSRTFYYSASG
jgi:hypothetical protein